MTSRSRGEGALQNVKTFVMDYVNGTVRRKERGPKMRKNCETSYMDGPLFFLQSLYVSDWGQVWLQPIAAGDLLPFPLAHLTASLVAFTRPGKYQEEIYYQMSAGKIQ